MADEAAAKEKQRLKEQQITDGAAVEEYRSLREQQMKQQLKKNRV